MQLYCRNPSCEFHTRPIEGSPLYCPKDGLPLMGSVLESEAAPLEKPREATQAPTAPPASEPKPSRLPPPAPESVPPPAAKPPRAGLIQNLFARDRGSDRTKPLVPGPAAPRPQDLISDATALARLDRIGPLESPAPGSADPRATTEDGRRAGRSTLRGLATYVITMIGDSTWEPRRIAGNYNKPIYRKSDGRSAGPASRIAVLHLRNTIRGLEIRPGDSINGVFLMITRSVEIDDRTQFRIGDYIFRYQTTQAPVRIEPQGRDGERFFVRDPGAVNSIAILRPDGSPGPTFPLMQPIVFGRGGPEDPHVDLPLFDENVSRQHARLTPLRDIARLEDLGSRNGTFLQIEGPTLVVDEAVLRLGEARIRITREA